MRFSTLIKSRFLTNARYKALIILIKKLSVHNQRMLELLKYARQKHLVQTDGEFFEKIGFLHQNYYGIKDSSRSFTIEQMIKACELTGSSMDWLCGLSERRVIRKEIPEPLEMIKEAVRIMETNGHKSLRKTVPKTFLKKS